MIKKVILLQICLISFLFGKVEKFDQEQLNNYIVNTPYIVKNSYLKNYYKTCYDKTIITSNNDIILPEKCKMFKFYFKSDNDKTITIGITQYDKIQELISKLNSSDLTQRRNIYNEILSNDIKKLNQPILNNDTKSIDTKIDIPKPTVFNNQQLEKKNDSTIDSTIKIILFLIVSTLLIFGITFLILKKRQLKIKSSFEKIKTSEIITENQKSENLFELFKKIKTQTEKKD